jgi:hypothetical protein
MVPKAENFRMVRMADVLTLYRSEETAINYCPAARGGIPKD